MILYGDSDVIIEAFAAQDWRGGIGRVSAVLGASVVTWNWLNISHCRLNLGPVPVSISLTSNLVREMKGLYVSEAHRKQCDALLTTLKRQVRSNTKEWNKRIILRSIEAKTSWKLWYLSFVATKRGKKKVRKHNKTKGIRQKKNNTRGFQRGPPL